MWLTRCRKHIYNDKQNPQVLEILKLLLANYGEVYLRSKHDNYLIRTLVFSYRRVEHKFHSFFIDQDTALKNEDVTTLGQMELVCEIYKLYCLFTHWVRKYSSRQNIKSMGDLFFTRLSQIINDLCKEVLHAADKIGVGRGEQREGGGDMQAVRQV
ncbi:MAG: hypothetical protein P4M11_15770 [Candidatus Pacebacteria bacterium]|nr:hypothetical protein [Candidatus Paceibacterota bacterium]